MITLSELSPRWPKFASYLLEMLGLPDEDTTAPCWMRTCDGTFTYTRRALRHMGFDIKSSMDYLASHGITCDCDAFVTLQMLRPAELDDLDRSLDTRK